MEYSGVSSLGSRTQIPVEWVALIARAREYPLAAQVQFLRVVSAFNHSAAQHAASALGPDIATPLVPVASAEARVAMIARWLDSGQFSADEKQAMATAWKLMDRPGASAAEDDLGMPPSVRLLLRQVTR